MSRRRQPMNNVNICNHFTTSPLAVAMFYSLHLQLFFKTCAHFYIYNHRPYIYFI